MISPQTPEKICMLGSELFLRALRSQNVENIFGIPGREAEAILFDEVEGLNFYLTRHEFSAGVMADVFARLTGRMQSCFSTFGPGMTNLSTGVASAMQDRSPLLAVSAQIELHDVAFNHCHQCLDNAGVMRNVSKHTAEMTEALQIPRLVADATVEANTELFGPSFLSFPINAMQQVVDDAAAQKELERFAHAKGRPVTQPDSASIRELHRLLMHAQKPVAIVGNSILRHGATSELRAVVEKYRLPVVSTLASKGALSDEHPFAAGAVNRYLDGILGDTFLDHVFADTDLLVLIGYDLVEDVKPAHWLRRSKRPTTVLISSVPNPVESLVQTELEIVGNPKRVLSMLSNPELASVRADKGPAPVLDEIRRRKQRLIAPTQGPVTPESVVGAVRRALGPEGVLVSDIGLHKQYAGLLSETSRPNTFICSNGLGAFGFGLPAALGAQLARPDHPVVAIVGDGGFLSNSADLETAVRYRLPIVVVVLKDGAFGLIKHYQLRGKDRSSGNAVEFLGTDFERLALAHGCDAATCQTLPQLETRLGAALAARTPTLIQVPLQYRYQF